MLDMVIGVQALSSLSTDQTVIEYVRNLFIMQGYMLLRFTFKAHNRLKVHHFSGHELFL